VCLESLKQGQVITVGCCNKQFHSECYIRAMQVGQSCPLCRKEHHVIEMPPQPVVLVVDTRARRIVSVSALSLFSLLFLGLFVFNR